jgi:hypothetical protein
MLAQLFPYQAGKKVLENYEENSGTNKLQLKTDFWPIRIEVYNTQINPFQ